MYDDLVAVYRRDLERQKLNRLTPEEQAKLAREGRYDELAEAMLPLVLKVLRDVLKDLHFDFEQDIRADLLQAGNLAMLVAIKSWNPDAECGGVALTTWVYQSVRRDMFREFHKQRQVVRGIYQESVYGFSPNFEDLFSDDGAQMVNRNSEFVDLGIFGGGSDGEGGIWVEYPDAMLTEEGNVPDEASRAKWSERLVDALEELPEQQRQSVLLTEVQGLSTREAGDALGISHTYVAKLRSAALKALKERLLFTI